MATFFFCGRYSAEALANISPERTAKAKKLIKELGGKVVGVYGLLGDTDLVVIADLPGTTEAVKASIGLRRLTDISFSTTVAIPVDEFDKIATGG
jgi:uncharacterized protein with GYD domain